MMAGRLNKLIEVWNPSLEDAGGGNQTSTLERVALLWAEVEDLSGQERYQLGTVGFAVSHKITTRYTTLIKITSVFKLGDREFHVVSISNPRNRNEYLEINAIEETTDA